MNNTNTPTATGIDKDLDRALRGPYQPLVDNAIHHINDKKDWDVLKADILRLVHAVGELYNENSQLKARIENLQQDYENAVGAVAEYRICETENVQLKARIAELETSTRVPDKNGRIIREGDRVKRRVMQAGGDFIDVYCYVRWGKWCYCLYIADKYVGCLDTPTANGLEVVEKQP